MLLLLLAGSSLAREPQPAGPSEAVGVNASPAANAPWFKITVDAYDVGQYASVAIDPVNNTTYISYYDETYKDLRMAKYVGSGGNCGPNNDWSCETVDSAGDVGKYSSIAINPVSGGVGIAYYDATNGELKYAYSEICPTCSWSIDTVDWTTNIFGNMGQYSSLKYHSNGKPYIAYYYENLIGVDKLKLARGGLAMGNCGSGSAGMWQCDTISSGDQVGKYTSLALDGSDRPRIAYYDGVNNALWYAQYGTSWFTLKILPDNSGQYASLYVDNGDISHIAHYDSSNGKLGYAVYVGSGGNANCGVFDSKFWWRCDDIESVGTITHPKGLSLAVDAASYPIIAYQKGGSLKVARPLDALGLLAGSGNCGPEDPFSTWKCETIDPFQSLGPVVNGDFVSIALNSSGLATIAYYQEFSASFTGILKVAYQQLQGFLPLVMKNQ
jgi:hypothetical protein